MFQNRVWNIHLCQYDCFEGKGCTALKHFISRPRNLLKIAWSSVINHWFGHWNKEKNNPIICKNAKSKPHCFLQMKGVDFLLACIDQIVIFSIKGRSYLLLKVTCSIYWEISGVSGIYENRIENRSVCVCCNLQLEPVFPASSVFLWGSACHLFHRKLLWAGLILGLWYETRWQSSQVGEKSEKSYARLGKPKVTKRHILLIECQIQHQH